MPKDYRVNVYLDEFDRDQVIARVRYNAALDQWDGRNFSNGGVGMHKGITKLKDGRYVIIEGTDWLKGRAIAYIVSDSVALEEILKSGNGYLLDTKKFAELNKFYKKYLPFEYDEDEE